MTIYRTLGYTAAGRGSPSRHSREALDRISRASLERQWIPRRQRVTICLRARSNRSRREAEVSAVCCAEPGYARKRVTRWATARRYPPVLGWYTVPTSAATPLPPAARAPNSSASLPTHRPAGAAGASSRRVSRGGRSRAGTLVDPVAARILRCALQRIDSLQQSGDLGVHVGQDIAAPA